MADAIASRPGMVNNAGAEDVNFLKVYAGEVLQAFVEANTTMDKHMVRTIEHGKSATFPVIGKKTWPAIIRPWRGDPGRIGLHP